MYCFKNTLGIYIPEVFLKQFEHIIYMGRNKYNVKKNRDKHKKDLCLSNIGVDNMAEEVDQTGWTEEQKLLYKHYGRKPGDDSFITQKMKHDIDESKGKASLDRKPTTEDLTAMKLGADLGRREIGLKDLEGRRIGISFNGVDAKLWGEVKIERMKRGTRKSELLEEALKLWLEKVRKKDGAVKDEH